VTDLRNQVKAIHKRVARYRLGEVHPHTNHHDTQLWLNAPSDTPDASRKKSLSAQTPKGGRGKAQVEGHQTSRSTKHVVGGGGWRL
jgi:hypothetical protein